MKTKQARCLLLAGVVLGVLATRETAAQTGAADAIAQKSAACGACHGANGVPISKDIPVIWGQHAGYTFEELHDFQTGARKNDVMALIVKDMTHAEMLALGEYFEAKPWPDLKSTASAGGYHERGPGDFGVRPVPAVPPWRLCRRQHDAAARRPEHRLPAPYDAGLPYRDAGQQSVDGGAAEDFHGRGYQHAGHLSWRAVSSGFPLAFLNRENSITLPEPRLIFDTKARSPRTSRSLLSDFEQCGCGRTTTFLVGLHVFRVEKLTVRLRIC